MQPPDFERKTLGSNYISFGTKKLIQNSFELTCLKIKRDIRDFVVTGNFGALW
jgi:hypothetical protein